MNDLFSVNRPTELQACHDEQLIKVEQVLSQTLQVHQQVRSVTVISV